jgi:hypothetical protein
MVLGNDSANRGVSRELDDAHDPVLVGREVRRAVVER